MPSPQTDSNSPRPSRRTPDDPLAVQSSLSRRLSQAVVIAVSTLTLLGIFIGIPVVRAVVPAVVQTVVPIVVRAVVSPPARPAAPPQKTTACTHNHMQAGPSHRHVCG